MKKSCIYNINSHQNWMSKIPFMWGENWL